MEEKKKVSIVVPVYNVPKKALRDCIESCIRQTLKEIEIILVDDGSTDESGVICDEYAEKDNRIIVIHKTNGGLSAARNTGYRYASGEWITFLDSDDWIEPATCEENYNVGNKENMDIVIFGTVQEFEHYKNIFTYHYKDGQKFIEDECRQLQCEILNFTGNIATAWAKLIKKSLLDNYGIEHNEILRQGSEGIEFNIRLFEHIKKAYFTDKVYYHYIFNPNSISAKHNERNHYFVIKCFEEIEKQIELSDNREALSKLFYKRFSYVVVAAAISGYFSPDNTQKFKEKKKSFFKYCENELVKTTIYNSKNYKIDATRRIILWCIDKKWIHIISLLARIRYRQKHI